MAIRSFRRQGKHSHISKPQIEQQEDDYFADVVALLSRPNSVVRAREVLAALILVCKRCGWWWLRCRVQLPVKCPGCQSNLWRTARVSTGLQAPARKRYRAGFPSHLFADIKVDAAGNVREDHLADRTIGVKQERNSVVGARSRKRVLP